MLYKSRTSQKQQIIELNLKTNLVVSENTMNDIINEQNIEARDRSEERRVGKEC